MVGDVPTTHRLQRLVPCPDHRERTVRATRGPFAIGQKLRRVASATCLSDFLPRNDRERGTGVEAAGRKAERAQPLSLRGVSPSRKSANAMRRATTVEARGFARRSGPSKTRVRSHRVLVVVGDLGLDLRSLTFLLVLVAVLAPLARLDVGQVGFVLGDLDLDAGEGLAALLGERPPLVGDEVLGPTLAVDPGARQGGLDGRERRELLRAAAGGGRAASCGGS